MNETNKFKDAYGDSIQACFLSCGVIEINNSGVPLLTPDQAIEFAKQLIEIAEEVKNVANI